MKKSGSLSKMLFYADWANEYLLKLKEDPSLASDADIQHTRHPKIVIWNNIGMDRERLRAGINELVKVGTTQQHSAIVAKIRELVPEYIGHNNK